MLSNKLNESVHTTEEKSSKQEKKKLDKNTLEEVEVESSTPSDTNSEGKNNKYINIINKKLRTLRKRMVRHFYLFILFLFLFLYLYIYIYI